MNAAMAGAHRPVGHGGRNGAFWRRCRRVGATMAVVASVALVRVLLGAGSPSHRPCGRLPGALRTDGRMPAGTPQRYEFDLTPALQRAQRENKRLYVYLGADDCPYLPPYEAFLGRTPSELAPHFAKDYLVVDLRSSLKAQASKLFFRVGDRACPTPTSSARSATNARACWSTRACGCSTPSSSR